MDFQTRVKTLLFQHLIRVACNKGVPQPASAMMKLFPITQQWFEAHHDNVFHANARWLCFVRLGWSGKSCARFVGEDTKGGKLFVLRRVNRK